MNIQSLNVRTQESVVFLSSLLENDSSGVRTSGHAQMTDEKSNLCKVLCK